MHSILFLRACFLGCRPNRLAEQLSLPKIQRKQHKFIIVIATIKNTKTEKNIQEKGNNHKN